MNFRIGGFRPFHRFPISYMGFSTSSTLHRTHATILGCFIDESGKPKLSSIAQEFDDKNGGKILKAIEKTKFTAKTNECLPLLNSFDEKCVIVTGLGSCIIDYDSPERIDLKKENIRIAMGAAIQYCDKFIRSGKVKIDDCGDGKAAAEGLLLSSHKCDHWKSERSETRNFSCISVDKIVAKDFEEGKILAESQLFSKTLKETPSNLKYPESLAKSILQEFKLFSDIKISVHNEDWIISQKMGLLKSVSQGSDNKPVFLELHYNGSKCAKTICLVGKGITFDSGGISIKPSKGMQDMKGDMGGAACVLATIRAAARLKLPINLIVLVPLAENTINGRATKPGDLFVSRKGLTVEVDNTDAEGRLILADALSYAETLKPDEIIDVATLTGSIRASLGEVASGYFSHSKTMGQKLEKAACISGDRVWEMPLFKSHSSSLKGRIGDLSNIGNCDLAGASTAAAFLKNFVDTKEWIHIDIAGVMKTTGGTVYLPKGMTGRPTRTLIEYLILSSR